MLMVVFAAKMPLSLLFGSANWIAVWGYTPSNDFLQCWVTTIVPMGIFFVAMWEEIFTGLLILPI
eukprot:12880838-Ditylum_brightwellii.AAC.1